MFRLDLNFYVLTGVVDYTLDELVARNLGAIEALCASFERSRTDCSIGWRQALTLRF
jgi:hypothetical protein